MTSLCNQCISQWNECNSLFGWLVGVSEFPKIVEFEGKTFPGIASFTVSLNKFQLITSEQAAGK